MILRPSLLYLRDSLSHLAADGESLDESASSDERPCDLSFQLSGHVSEGLELIRVLADALQVVFSDDVLGVEQREHALQQPRPKVVEHFLQVDVAPRVVALELGEEILENLGVLHIRLAVRPLEHLVQGPLGVLQKLQEEFCKEN